MENMLFVTEKYGLKAIGTQSLWTAVFGKPLYTLESSNLKCLGFKIHAKKREIIYGETFFGVGIVSEYYDKWRVPPTMPGKGNFIWYNDGQIYADRHKNEHLQK